MAQQPTKKPKLPENPRMGDEREEDGVTLVFTRRGKWLPSDSRDPLVKDAKRYKAAKEAAKGG